MKYLRKFESNDVLYKQIPYSTYYQTASDDFSGMRITDLSDESLKIIKSYFKSKIPPHLSRQFDIMSFHFELPAFQIKRQVPVNNDSNTHMDIKSIAIRFQKEKDDFCVDIWEYIDDWFCVSICIRNWTFDKQTRKYTRDETYSFKCDTIEGVIQVLDKYI